MSSPPYTERGWLRTVRSLAKMLLASLVIFGVTTVMTLKLKHDAELGLQATRDLQSVVSEFHAQDALEWQVIGGRAAPGWVHEELEQSRSRATVLITRARAGGLSASDQAELVTRARRYAVAVDQEVQLLHDLEPERARQVDEAAVDPARAAFQKALTGYLGQVSNRADRARRLSDFGIMLMATLAFLLTAGLLGRRQLGEQRRERERLVEARYRTLVDQSADLVVVIGRDRGLRYLSPSAVRVLGRSLNDATATELIERVHPADREPLGSALAAVVSQPGIEIVEVRLRPHGDVGRAESTESTGPTESTESTGPMESTRLEEVAEPGWRIFEVSIQDLTADPAVGGLVLTGRDVTVRQALRLELEHRALHDTLTGLPNRALLAERLGEALRAGRRTGTATGLLLIDLDRFKEINDTLGHSYGDLLLAQVGPRLAGALRPVDLVARLGGDEFAVLLAEVSGLDTALEVAEKLQAALARSFQVVGVDLDVEASIGVVVSGEHGDDVSTLMQRADIAMYAAKQRALGVASYDPDADSHTVERLALLGDLRRALTNDELFLHYQPKVSLSTGEVCGAEALLRWRHPERGLIPPDAFIPLAENTGLIGPLTAHVLDLALAQARRWVDQGLPLPIAVNLSARNLLDEDFDRVVGELLTRHGVPSSLLELEVTESAVMTDPTRAADLLQRLAGQGIAISIDDFGAGYTSIGQLRNLPITELKVDQSFVTGMENDPSNSLIVRSVIELGHNLGMRSVAEGVETLETLGRLIGYHCDIAQGYYLSRPLPAASFEKWRADWPGLPERPADPGAAAPAPGVPGPRGVGAEDHA